MTSFMSYEIDTTTSELKFRTDLLIPMLDLKFTPIRATKIVSTPLSIKLTKGQVNQKF